jgi:hypothetical protein
MEFDDDDDDNDSRWSPPAEVDMNELDDDEAWCSDCSLGRLLLLLPLLPLWLLLLPLMQFSVWVVVVLLPSLLLVFLLVDDVVKDDSFKSSSLPELAGAPASVPGEHDEQVKSSCKPPPREIKRRVH